MCRIHAGMSSYICTCVSSPDYIRTPHATYEEKVVTECASLSLSCFIFVNIKITS